MQAQSKYIVLPYNFSKRLETLWKMLMKELLLLFKKMMIIRQHRTLKVAISSNIYVKNINVFFNGRITIKQGCL